MTGSHSSRRTSWGDAAGTFSLSFFECGRIDGWVCVRATSTVAAPAARHSWTLQRSVLAHTRERVAKLRAH